MMQTKKFILIIGDSVMFWAAFAAVFLIRAYGAVVPLPDRLVPTLFVFLITIAIVYAMGLYSAQYLLGKIEWITNAMIGLALSLFATATFYYFYSRIVPGITPRGSLLMEWGVFSALFILWRIMIERTILMNLTERTLIIGSDSHAIQLAEILKSAPGVGFDIVGIFPATQETYHSLADTVKRERAENIIFLETPSQREAQHVLERLMDLNVNYYDSASFFEQRLQKVQLDSLSHVWILNNILQRRAPLALALYDGFQRMVACALLVIAAPLMALVALAIALAHGQSPLYTQQRVGKDGKIFTLYKFRTMRDNAEPNGPQWAAEHDPRITPIGKILRASHLDELPQLINIAKGGMAFVGPRPERPEFVTELSKNLPFYAMRHHVKPGVTGWAQINYPYGASIEDAKEKLQYDLYYLKQRSLFVDLMIIVRTLRLFFQNPSRA